MDSIALWWPVLLTSLGLGGIGGYFAGRALSWKRLVDVERKLEVLEGHQGDIYERFTRFQNREGMRLARASKATDEDLKLEAMKYLAEHGGDAQLHQEEGGRKRLYELLRANRGR